jgi:DNA-binding MarR family transcriptional regulator
VSAVDLLTNYFNFAESRDKIQLKYKVTHRECIILRMITSAYHDGHKLTVSDVIQQKSIASPATSHASLKSLIEKKLIENKPCTKDARVKKLIPTEKAIKLYKELGMLLVNTKK